MAALSSRSTTANEKEVATRLHTLDTLSDDDKGSDSEALAKEEEERMVASSIAFILFNGAELNTDSGTLTNTSFCFFFLSALSSKLIDTDTSTSTGLTGSFENCNSAVADDDEEDFLLRSRHTNRTPSSTILLDTDDDEEEDDDGSAHDTFEEEINLSVTLLTGDDDDDF